MTRTVILQSGNEHEALYSVEDFQSIQLVIREMNSLEPSEWLLNTVLNVIGEKFVRIKIFEHFLILSTGNAEFTPINISFSENKCIDFNGQYLFIVVGYDHDGSVSEQLVDEICLLPTGLDWNLIQKYADATQSTKSVFPQISVQRFFPAFLQTGFDFVDSSVFVSGCGTGGELLALRYLGAQKITGVEPDLDARKIAVKYTKPFGEIQVFRNQDRFANTKYDFVISRHVLEHVPRDGRKDYLISLLKKLNPSGKLYIEVPNQDCPVEPHTDLLFFHWLSEERKRQAVDYFERMELEGIRVPVETERLRKIIGHTNISYEEIVSYIPSGFKILKKEYTDSSFIYNNSNATTLLVWVQAV